MNSDIRGFEVSILSAAFTDCVTLGKSLNPTEPQFPYTYK